LFIGAYTYTYEYTHLCQEGSVLGDVGFEENQNLPEFPSLPKTYDFWVGFGFKVS